MFVKVHTTDYLGEAWFGIGEFKKAKQICDHTIKFLNEINSSPSDNSLESGRMIRLLGKIALAQGKLDLAEENLQHSLQIFTAQGNQLEIGRTLSSLMNVATGRGDLELSLTYTQKAQRIFRRLGAKHDLKQLNKLKSGSV